MAYRDRYDMEPLQIRAWLRTPVVADRWLPLDALLLYQAHRAALGPQIVTLPGEYSQRGISTLPLAIEHPGRKNWYYRCSWAQWSHDVEGTDYWNKRFDSQFADLVDFDGRRGKVIIEQGAYKAYHMPVFYRAALWICWYCVGDRAEIEHLLCTVTHLGKKRSQGWGRVASWDVQPWPEDWSVWKEGQLVRGVPIEDAGPGGHNLLYYGIRPSYWHRNNQMPLMMPR